MKGLTTKEVEERIRNGQVNTKAGLKTKTVGQIVLENSCTLFNLVNVLLAVCLLLVHSYRNMLFIGVVFSNLLIGIIQELRAKYVMDKLSLLTEAHVPVIRDGVSKEISMHEIVKDDFIQLKAGMQICADAIVEEGECEVDESLLTGESVPIAKQKGDLLLSGSFLVSGQIYAKVQKVGEESYANQIASSAKYMKKVNSEIKTSVMKIIKMVSIAIFPIAVLFFWNQINLNNASLQTAVENTVAALLGMIPEGLVLLTSIVMAVSVVRLAKKKTLVQQMYCVETLARVDVFCLDKTGTLTEGRMQLIGKQALSSQDFEEPLAEMMGAMKEGNATFQAIHKCYHSQKWPIQNIVPFSSERKWSAVSFEEKGSFILGAPSFVVSHLESQWKAMIEKHITQGERVLLFAHANATLMDKCLPEQIKPLAFLFLEDVIKESAPKTINYLKKQNVDLKIISGDNPKAVSDIARRVGIAHADQYVDCSVLEREEQLIAAAEEKTVFGRVSPQQKKLLVKTLKKNHTVAMTGDGVNDVLALKEADCSIAMQNGSEAARNIADLVLLKSDFVSIPAIIAEGRRAINNLQRSSSLFLTKTVFSVILAVLFCFLNWKYPFQPIQMSLISAICIGIPSFILALEPNYNLVTPGFLRKVFRISLPGGLLVAINILACVALGKFMHISAENVSTLTTFMAAFVFAVILFKICYPFNLLRYILYIGLFAIFIFMSYFAKPVFFFTKLSLECYFIIGILEGINVIIFNALQKLIILFMEQHLKRHGKSTGVE